MQKFSAYFNVTGDGDRTVAIVAKDSDDAVAQAKALQTSGSGTLIVTPEIGTGTRQFTFMDRRTGVIFSEQL